MALCPSVLLYRLASGVFETLSSSNGVRQGCVLASLLYSLSMQRKYTAAILSRPVRAVAIIDDYYIFGSAKHALDAFDAYRTSLRTSNAGIELNPSKMWAIWVAPDGSSPPSRIVASCQTRGISLVDPSCVKLLGSYVGTDASVMADTLASSKLRDTQQLCAGLLGMSDSLGATQAASLILRFCANARPTYLCRTLAPPITARYTQLHDRLLFGTFLSLYRLPANLAPEARLRLSLPLRLAGSGLRPSHRTRFAAFWGSAAVALFWVHRYSLRSLPPVSASGVPSSLSLATQPDPVLAVSPVGSLADSPRLSPTPLSLSSPASPSWSQTYFPEPGDQLKVFSPSGSLSLRLSASTSASAHVHSPSPAPFSSLVPLVDPASASLTSAPLLLQEPLSGSSSPSGCCSPHPAEGAQGGHGRVGPQGSPPPRPSWNAGWDPSSPFAASLSGAAVPFASRRLGRPRPLASLQPMSSSVACSFRGAARSPSGEAERPLGPVSPSGHCFPVAGDAGARAPAPLVPLPHIAIRMQAVYDHLVGLGIPVEAESPFFFDPSFRDVTELLVQFPAPKGIQRLLTGALEDLLHMDSLGLLEQRAAHADPAVSRPALAQKARLQSASATNAAAWLVAIPSEPSLSLSSISCAFAMRHRLGLWPDDDMPFLCVCGMDPRSHHAHFHACKKLKRLAITWRHDLVMAALRLSGQEAGALVLLEDHSRRSAWPDIHSRLSPQTLVRTHPLVE